MTLINKRIPAFTLIELIVAMALSGIVIGIIYTSHTIIEQQYTRIKLSGQKISQLKNLNFLLENDFNESESILKNLNQVSLNKDGNSNHIVYLFEEEYVIRNKMNHVDTFFVKTKKIESKFLYPAINSNNFIEELKIEIITFDESIFFTLNKTYASDIFLKSEHCK